MKKIWLVFKYEYLRHVFRKRFLIILLSMPLFVLLMGGVGILSAILSIDNTPVAYIDHSGLLAEKADAFSSTDTGPFSGASLVPYSSEEEARQALDQGQIQAYYIIPADYLQSGSVRLVAEDAQASSAAGSLETMLRASLLKNESPEISRRILSGPNFTIRSSDQSREMNQNDFLGIILPLAAGILFVIAINTSGGYLLQAVVEEKENRTMEIVITSVSPEQLMAGKILGNLSVGLTQLAVWIAFLAIGLFIGRFFAFFSTDSILKSSALWLMLATLLPAFVLVAALMAAVGATATESREAQQIAGIFTLPVVVPYWFTSSIMSNPNGPVATILSIFPLTAPVALPLRSVFTNLPAWQIGLTLAMMYAAAIGALWLAGRAFRMGMLRYGKRLGWRELFHRPVKA